MTKLQKCIDELQEANLANGILRSDLAMYETTRGIGKVKLARELMDVKDENKRLNDLLDWYRAAFVFMNNREEFQNHWHLLTEHMKRLKTPADGAKDS